MPGFYDHFPREIAGRPPQDPGLEAVAAGYCSDGIRILLRSDYSEPDPHR